MATNFLQILPRLILVIHHVMDMIKLHVSHSEISIYSPLSIVTDQIFAGGGSSAYDVYLTGMTSSVAIMDESSATTSAGTTTTAAGVTYVTQAGQTIVITASSEASTSAKSSSSGGSSNTAGIAAGVVVGVVALSAIIGAAIFFWRRQQKKRVEEEYRRNAEINSFAQKPASMSSDSRWDGDFMAQRRQSNGSIADDQDFSRRILQVSLT